MYVNDTNAPPTNLLEQLLRLRFHLAAAAYAARIESSFPVGACEVRERSPATLPCRSVAAIYCTPVLFRIFLAVVSRAILEVLLASASLHRVLGPPWLLR